MIAEPSPTGRVASGRLSRKVTGEVSEAAAASEQHKTGILRFALNYKMELSLCGGAEFRQIVV